MAEFIVQDRSNVVCPECGNQVTGYESRRGTREKVNVYEAWPGGPTLEVPTKQVIMEPDGPFITTLEPCGHRVDRPPVFESAPLRSADSLLGYVRW